MNYKQNSRQLLFGSICGIIGTICYIVAVTIQLPPSIGFLLVTIWPMATIIFAFSIYKYIAIDNQSTSNQLAFLFTIIAFVLAYIMLSIQVGLGMGIGDAIAKANGSEKEMLSLIQDSVNWVHLGIDLAWDMFLGVSLILLAVAVKGHSKLGIGWSIPLAILGVSVIAVNLYTLPYTPQSQGIFDIGPVIGTFMIILAARTLYLSLKMKRA
jgi:hypothetical protein